MPHHPGMENTPVLLLRRTNLRHGLMGLLNPPSERAEPRSRGRGVSRASGRARGALFAPGELGERPAERGAQGTASAFCSRRATGARFFRPFLCAYKEMDPSCGGGSPLIYAAAGRSITGGSTRLKWPA